MPEAIRRQVGNDFFHTVVEVNCVYSDDTGKRFDNHNIEPAPLEHLVHFPKLRSLFLHDRQANDTNLAYVARLKHLERFFVWDAHDVTDAGVEHLRTLKDLEYIHISESQITDASLQLFAMMPRLEGLSLQFNHFTDEGVRSLAALPRLRTLWVCGKDGQPNEITDPSLEFLLRLPEFESLGVQSTYVTSDFEDRLKERFPKCSIAR